MTPRGALQQVTDDDKENDEDVLTRGRNGC